MGEIIAGRFQQQVQTERVMAALRQDGIDGNSITSFFVNPRGQHDQFPGGGDEDASPGATEAHSSAWGGATAGAAIGAAVGVAAAAALGPIGLVAAAGAGAYAGSLHGALAGTAENDDTYRGHVERHSGMLVAAQVTSEQRDAVIRILEREGAEDIEHARGTIIDGSWVDFDPLRRVDLEFAPTQPV